MADNVASADDWYALLNGGGSVPGGLAAPPGAPGVAVTEIDPTKILGVIGDTTTKITGQYYTSEQNTAAQRAATEIALAKSAAEVQIAEAKASVERAKAAQVAPVVMSPPPLAAAPPPAPPAPTATKTAASPATGFFSKPLNVVGATAAVVLGGWGLFRLARD